MVLEFPVGLALLLHPCPRLGLVDLVSLALLEDLLDLFPLALLVFQLGLVDRSDLGFLVSLEFPVVLVLPSPRLLLVSLVDLVLLEFLVVQLALEFLEDLVFLVDLDLPSPQLLLVSLVDLEFLAGLLDLFLLAHLVFLVDPVNPSLRLLPFLLSLLSLQPALSLRYLRLPLSNRLLRSVQVAHRMDLSLLSDLMVPLGQSVLLVLLKVPLPLLDLLFQLDL